LEETAIHRQPAPLGRDPEGARGIQMTDDPDRELPESPPPRRRRVAENHWVLFVILAVFLVVWLIFG
jgi:hypothetical protein